MRVRKSKGIILKLDFIELLHCFENVSGLRINYQKSEVLVLGGSENEQIRVAEMLNCKVGSLLIKVLGDHGS